MDPVCSISGTRVSDKRSGLYGSLIYTFESKAESFGVPGEPIRFRFGIILEAELDCIVVEVEVRARVQMPVKKITSIFSSRSTMSWSTKMRMELEDVERELTNEDVDKFLREFDMELF